MLLEFSGYFFGAALGLSVLSILNYRHARKMLNEARKIHQQALKDEKEIANRLRNAVRLEKESAETSRQVQQKLQDAANFFTYERLN